MGDFSYLGKLSYFITLNPVAMAGDDFPSMIPLGKPSFKIIQVFMVRFSIRKNIHELIHVGDADLPMMIFL